MERFAQRTRTPTTKNLRSCTPSAPGLGMRSPTKGLFVVWPRQDQSAHWRRVPGWRPARGVPLHRAALRHWIHMQEENAIWGTPLHQTCTPGILARTAAHPSRRQRQPAGPQGPCDPSTPRHVRVEVHTSLQEKTAASSAADGALARRSRHLQLFKIHAMQPNTDCLQALLSPPQQHTPSAGAQRIRQRKWRTQNTLQILDRMRLRRPSCWPHTRSHRPRSLKNLARAWTIAVRRNNALLIAGRHIMTYYDNRHAKMDSHLETKFVLQDISLYERATKMHERVAQMHKRATQMHERATQLRKRKWHRTHHNTTKNSRKKITDSTCDSACVQMQ